MVGMLGSVIDRLAAFSIDPGDLAFRDDEDLRVHLYALEAVEVRLLGHSRDQLELYGLRFGEGRQHVALIAGCHADEPVGPVTAQIVSRVLKNHFPEILDQFRFHVVPQMNPDGAERNRPWFAQPPNLGQYLEHVVRELPGDDLEFGFGHGVGVRPECQAAQDFLGKHGPYVAHFSLHGMAFAEGAWCLIDKEWADRSVPYMDAFSELCRSLAFPLHDIDRNGEKGFFRIREGFCTCPTAEAMKGHFLLKNDKATARKFMPSSMEYVQSLGGDPVCIVSEVPLFLMGSRSPNLQEPLSQGLKDDLSSLRFSGPKANQEAVQEVVERYGLTATPLELQVRLQVAMIVLALSTLVTQASS